MILIQVEHLILFLINERKLKGSGYLTGSDLLVLDAIQLVMLFSLAYRRFSAIPRCCSNPSSYENYRYVNNKFNVNKKKTIELESKTCSSTYMILVL